MLFRSYYFVVAVLAITLVLLWRLVHSPFGKALQAIRMNETRARFVGYHVWLTKWAVLCLSGVFAGVSGGLLAVSQESAYPDVMNVHSSGASTTFTGTLRALASDETRAFSARSLVAAMISA